MTSDDSLEMLDLIEQQVEPTQTRLRTYVGALRANLEDQAKRNEETEAQLAQYQAAYEKLTQPANRIGTFLKWVDSDGAQLPLVLLGDSEYVAMCDPKVDAEKLVTGARVRLNDAYAIVGMAPVSEHGSMARVSKLVDEKRVMIGGDAPGSDSRIIYLAEREELDKPKPGDDVLLDPSGRFAIDVFEREKNKDLYVEDIPDITWEQVGGQEQAIELVRETIEHPLLHPEIYKQYNKEPIKGILLYGPPGCGKTLIGKAIASTLTKEYSARKGEPVKEYFMAISGPKILNMWVGESERMVREIFATAREKAKDGFLVFIFMDEAESLLRTRSSGRHFSMSNTIVPQFCAELDGLATSKNVVLILTSNRPDYIDPAVLRPGRIDRKVKIKRPEADAAKRILEIYLTSDVPVQGDRSQMIEKVVDELWSKKEHNEFLELSLRSGKRQTLLRGDMISGAILESIVDRAKMSAIRRSIADPKAPSGVTEGDLLLALNNEFQENEIFPKSDALEDWLQLLDVEPENVVAIRPMSKAKGNEHTSKGIV